MWPTYEIVAPMVVVMQPNNCTYVARYYVLVQNI